MQYVIHYDVAALFITGLLLLMNLLRRGYSTLSGRRFTGLMLVTFLAAALDIVTAYTISYADVVPLPLNYLVNCLYLIANNASAVFFYVYVLTVTKGKRATQWERAAWRIVAALEVVLVSLSPFTTWIFTFGADRVYRHGSFFPVLYGLALFMLALSIVLIVRNHRNMNRMQAISISLYVVAVILSGAVRHLLFHGKTGGLHVPQYLLL